MSRVHNSNEFLDLVRELEMLEFPEFGTGHYVKSPEVLYHNNYSPSYHIRNGLLNRPIITDIKSNDRLVLSVGSGKAYLERFLVSRMDIRREQIVLSDRDSYMPEGFRQFVFDMYGDWPDFGQKFDYVIFPQSLSIPDAPFPEKTDKLCHIVRCSLKTLKPRGQVRIDGHFLSDLVLTYVKGLLEYESKLRLTYSKDAIIVKRLGRGS